VTENATPQKLVFSIEKMIGNFDKKFYFNFQIPSNFLGEAIWVRRYWKKIKENSGFFSGETNRVAPGDRG